MKKNGIRRLLSGLMCLVLLLSLLPAMRTAAVEPGDSYVPNPASWGVQNNNGWYYLYRDTNGLYKEMNFYASSDIPWQVNAFASDPNTQFEMFFITQNTLFVGELGSRPAYGFKAPASGEIVLTMQTHSTSEMHMQVYVEDELQKIGGEDSLTLTTGGTLPGGMTKTELTLQVTEGEMVYVEFYSTDINTQRQAWINEYSVKYLSIEEDLTGVTFAPDMEAWGTQSNNGWYYMSKDGNGFYNQMNYYDSSATIDWQRNAFASDPYTQYEMFFINRTTFFTGELGTLPVYAFKAPVGGEVTLYFETHGVDCLYYQIFLDEDLKQDKTPFTTAGTLEGGFTATELNLNVKKNEMIYIVVGTTGADRGGWLRNYRVTYLSTNDEVDYTAVNYAPDAALWGIQNNNGWYYMYQNGNTGLYGLLDFYDSTATIDWQRNRYAFDPYTMGEMLFIEQNHYFTGELGSKPVYAFKAPVGGELEIYFEIHGLDSMGVSAYVEDELVQIEGKDRYTFVTTGSLPGAFTPVSFTCNVAAGETVYLVCSGTNPSNRDGWFRNQRAKYLSVNGEVADPDDPIEEEKPMVEGSAAEWNKTTDYYAQLQEKLQSDEPMTWLFVGDSITANDGDVGRGYRSYVEIFDSYLKTVLGRVNDRVVNTAVSGWKVSNINYERDIAAYAPDVVYVKVGTNDSFLTDYAADSFVASMGNLYDKIIAGGAIPVVAAANGFSSNWGNTQQTEAFALRYPDAIRTLAYEKKLLLVDYFTRYAQDQAFADAYFFCPDTIHPNRAGFLVHAQTLIGDLGLAQDSAIMNQSVLNLSAQEVDNAMVFTDMKPSAYIFGKELLAQMDLSNGFVLVGGLNAVGAGDSMVTTRSIHQYLNNNHQLGRNETLYISAADAKTLDYTAYAEGKIILLMPEAFGLNDESLWAGATAEDIVAVIEKMESDGKTVVLISPPPVSGSGSRETNALEQATLAASEQTGCAFIDLNMYMGAVGTLADTSSWYNGKTLTFAGANEAAMMIGSAFGLDAVSYSDNRFLERFDPTTWGTQGADGFYYLYQSKSGGDYAQLPFISAEDAPASWLKDRYSLAVDEYTFIGQDVIHAGANYNPVKAYRVPYTGTVRVTLKHRRGVADVSEGGDAGTMWLKTFHNDEAVGEKTALLLDYGRYNTTYFEVEVKAGDWIYVMVDAEVPGQCDVLETVTYTKRVYQDAETCDHENTEIRGAVAATCTEPGYTGDTYCIDCGEKLATGEAIAATGHGETQLRNAKEPTCTEAGYTGDTHCTVCGEKLAEGEAIAPLGHNFADGSCTRCGEEDPNALPENPFTDVKEGDYYFTPILWAVKQGITNGTTPDTFSPENPCTRGQIVTFLWRAFGSPEPTSRENPFTDVPETVYYYKAILWAVEQGITTGTTATTFSPEDTCTRGQVATFLWRACGKPAPQGSENPFSDVPETVYYYEPILWAVENGITNGTGNGKFSPEDSCTRGQIVTFLYRALAE